MGQPGCNDVTPSRSCSSGGTISKQSVVLAQGQADLAAKKAEGHDKSLIVDKALDNMKGEQAARTRALNRGKEGI